MGSEGKGAIRKRKATDLSVINTDKNLQAKKS